MEMCVMSLCETPPSLTISVTLIHYCSAPTVACIMCDWSVPEHSLILIKLTITGIAISYRSPAETNLKSR